MRFVRQSLGLDRTLFDASMDFLSRNVGQDGEVEVGRGDEVDHSSERPFQGSPVTSRRASRFRMLTTICMTWQKTPASITATPKVET
jgi:hypothetical protein